jgi:metal-dependent amidase/aminoacylase/carboxypeptidase family protein
MEWDIDGSFQPAEEIDKGARAMIEDGLSTKFPKHDIILVQKKTLSLTSNFRN